MVQHHQSWSSSLLVRFPNPVATGSGGTWRRHYQPLSGRVLLSRWSIPANPLVLLLRFAHHAWDMFNYYYYYYDLLLLFSFFKSTEYNFVCDVFICLCFSVRKSWSKNWKNDWREVDEGDSDRLSYQIWQNETNTAKTLPEYPIFKVWHEIDA